MFWGLIMEPERRYSQQVKKAFHISMAALDLSSSGEEPAQVMCGYEGRNYLLCTLKKPDMIQCNLDLEFAAGAQVSFASNGKAHIHLTGYLTDMDDDGLNLADLEEQEEEDVEEEEKEEEKVGKNKKNKKKTIENGPPAKKAKVNGLSQSDSDDSDAVFEEDDDDNEAIESEDEEAEDDDESDEDGEEEDDEEAVEEEEEKKEVKLSKKQKKRLLQEQKAQQANGEQKKPEKKQQSQKKEKQILAKGVQIEDLVVGNGPNATAGKFVNVYYEGRLEKTGKMFDSSTKGAGFKFRLGAGEVIKGWDIGVVGMKVGGKRKIVCPPNAAYGPKGSPPVIPPNATLVFTVELKKIN